MSLSRTLFALAAAFGVLIAGLPAQSAQAAETSLQRMARTGTVVIGYRESSIPFSYLDESKRPVGYSIDLCRRLVGAIGKQLKREMKTEMRLVTSANRLDAVVNGQVDLECGSTTNNAERRARVAFTVPHFLTAARFMVRADSPIKGHIDLHRAVVVTTRGTTAETLFRQLNLQSRLEIAPDHAAAFAMLAAGKADAFMMDDILLASLRAAAPDPERYRILDETYRVEALAIMFSRDDPELKALVDREMKRLILDGEVETIYRQWFERPIPPNGINLRWPIGRLLRNSFRYPSDWAPD
ncbi:MAG: amino acid ABC transporter substrate-binding protein [Rhodocyclales bacterium GT-UBC]|nr:MAG: amino acid ABC transporter substrate-binding protein [Rhodocyclales bacterium GT-UBC]